MKSKRELIEPNRNELEINEHKLDQEWIGQPLLYYKYAMELAAARYSLDEAKRQLSVVEADLDTSIRSDPAHYGIEKVSEKSIASCITIQSEYQESVRTLNKANHAVRMLEAMTYALDHRKRALTNLVELHLANYFAEPKVPKEAHEAIEAATQKEVRTRARRRRERDEAEEE